MIRKIFVVTKGRLYDDHPIMAFSDKHEASGFAAKLFDEMYMEHVHEVQLAEGSIIDELLRGLERKLDREGIEITGIEFEGDHAEK